MKANWASSQYRRQTLSTAFITDGPCSRVTRIRHDQVILLKLQNPILLSSILLLGILSHVASAFSPTSPSLTSATVSNSRPQLYAAESNDPQDGGDDAGEDPNDPRVMRRMRGRYRNLQSSNNDNTPTKTSSSSAAAKAFNRAKKQQQASAAFDLPEQPVVKTIGGGTAMIFAMAQRMWKHERTTTTSDAANTAVNNTNINNQGFGIFARPWRPIQLGGISNYNPHFRTQSPEMNNQGYAGTIWRNVRKRNKPGLWRYALRTYDRMGNNAGGGNAPISKSMATVERTNVHHQGALLAAAKLGLWEKALRIYRTVENEQETFLRGSSMTNKLKLPVHVNDDMLVSLIYACVRSSRNMSSTEVSLEERRRPLDAACQVLDEALSRHGIQVESRHINPLSAAYHRLRLRQEAEALIGRLKDRRTGPEPEDGPQQFNVNDLSTKDKASYTLLVTGAVQEEDWESAVDALKNMTDAGLYPSQRHLNVWNEISERKTKHRTTRSWKKKRDENWIERGLR